MGKVFLIIGFICAWTSVFSQDEYKKFMDAGYNNYEDEDFEDARYYFEKAVEDSPLDFKANYNLANTYFRLAEYEKAEELYSSFSDMAPTNFDKAKAYHNLGNTHMVTNKLKDAIEAYKQSLRLNPSDEATRYNLAYAQELLKEQQKNQPPEQQEGDEGEKGDEGQEGDEGENDNEDDGETDKNEGNEKEGDEDKSQDKNGNNNEDEQGDQNKGEGYTQEMSKEEAERILKNAYKAEKKLQEKLDKEKVIVNGKAKKKDW